MAEYMVGVDLGGTKIQTILMDTNGEIISDYYCKTEAERGPDHVIEKIMDGIQKVKGNHRLKGIGIGAPGPLDPKKGLILSPPNLPGWDRIPLVEIIQDHFNEQVFLQNDANVAALAEYRFGAGKGIDDMVYITISTGIGAGIIVNGKLVSGAQGCAGELGNIIIHPDGKERDGLNNGSLEGLASGTAIGEEGYSRLQVTGGAQEVFELVKSNNEEAGKIIDEALTYLAIAIANTIHTINPTLFVLGGGVMKQAEMIIPLLKDKVRKRVYPVLQDHIEIEQAKLSQNAGAIGAALLPTL